MRCGHRSKTDLGSVAAKFKTKDGAHTKCCCWPCAMRRRSGRRPRRAGTGMDEAELKRLLGKLISPRPRRN
jgi:hypothetical protein